ncbi:DNA polymerase subunit beta [Sulfolobales archaeon HS-7]|nr:DNA polymerase subunit beta [Sulfolobales archaeon HS-7]
MGKAKSALKSQVDIIKRAIEFVNDVSKEVEVEKVYVVGSRARGDYLDTSDIDLMIISKEFEGLNNKQRGYMLSRFLRARIEFFAFTPSEWENPPFSLCRRDEERGKKA